MPWGFIFSQMASWPVPACHPRHLNIQQDHIGQVKMICAILFKPRFGGVTAVKFDGNVEVENSENAGLSDKA